MRFHHDHLNWENKITEYKKKKGGLLRVLLSLLSKSSYEALDNLPAFGISKAKRDTRTLWRLYRQVHLRSSASVNQGRVVTHIGLKQESGTHDNFVCRLRDLASLVEMYTSERS